MEKQENDTGQFHLRLEENLLNLIKKSAKKEKRSINSEIMLALEEKYSKTKEKN